MNEERSRGYGYCYGGCVGCGCGYDYRGYGYGRHDRSGTSLDPHSAYAYYAGSDSEAQTSSEGDDDYPAVKTIAKDRCQTLERQQQRLMHWLDNE